MKTLIKSEPPISSIQFGTMNAWKAIQSQRPDLTRPFLPKPGQRLISYGDPFRVCYLITTGSVNEAVPLEHTTYITRILQTGWILFPQALDDRRERYRSHVIVTVNEGTSLQPITKETAQLLQLNIQLHAEREDSYTQALNELNQARLQEFEYELADREWLFRYFIRNAVLEARIHALLQQLHDGGKPEALSAALMEECIRAIAALNDERDRLSAAQTSCSESVCLNLFGEEANKTPLRPKDSHTLAPEIPDGKHDTEDGTSMIPLPPDTDMESVEIVVDEDAPTQTGSQRVTVAFGPTMEDDTPPDSDNLPTIRPSASPESIRTGNTLPLPSAPANHGMHSTDITMEEEVPERKTYFGPEPDLHPNEGDRQTIAGMPAAFADPAEAAPLSSPVVSRPAPVAVRRGDLPGSDLDPSPPPSRRH